MTLLLDFRIPGEPVPAPRPRASGRIGKVKGKLAAITRIHMPKAYEAELEAVNKRAHAAGWHHARPYVGPVRVEVTAVHACPQSDERKRTPRPWRWWCGATNDVDNIAKTYLDALQPDGDRDRVIANDGEPARVEVRVYALPAEPPEALSLAPIFNHQESA